VGLDGFLGGGGGGGGGYPLRGGLGFLSGFLGGISFFKTFFFSLSIYYSSFYKFKVTKIDNKIEPTTKHAIENMLRQRTQQAKGF